MPSRLPPDIKQRDAIKAFERAGGLLRTSKRGHSVIRMPNGKLISLPSGRLKGGQIEDRIKLAGLTIEEGLEYLR